MKTTLCCLGNSLNPYNADNVVAHVLEHRQMGRKRLNSQTEQKKQEMRKK